jgi:EAL domain-containing protein (putative c-di-GMP-specific phosphodiesterase class I)/GGDEF domain-containing protein
MTLLEFYKSLVFPSRKTLYLLIFLIIVLLFTGYAIVEFTGGTRYAYLHVLYIPVILSGFAFSIRGGILAGVLAGFLLSPYMPTSVAYDLAQPWMSWTMRLVFFALVGGISGIGASIFKAYLKDLELRQIIDPLTNLPNMTGLNKTFIDITKDTQKPVIVIVVELFQKKDIEQTLGTEGTRLLLQTFAEDLKKAVGDQGTLGVIQLHQFTILVEDEEKVEGLLKDCEAIAQQPYHIQSVPLFIEIRFGISRYPYDDHDLDNLTRKALIAINLPKNQAARVSYFNKSTDDVSDRNLLILHQLKNAIDNKTLTLEYQPKVYLKTDEVFGFEALVRWKDPILGSVSPEEFIPLVEETLLINPFTQWLLETSLNQMNEWEKQGLLVPVSINYSMKNFQNPMIYTTLTRLLELYDLPQNMLEIEVTETSVASSLTTIANALNQLREIGLRTAIDDFGTGQASQQYLLELPIDVIKIDKVFVQSMFHNPAAGAIVKNAVLLAHDLNLKVVAEGVETHKQYELLKEWGCDAGQGYLIGRSMTGPDATRWLKKKLGRDSNQ